MQARLFDTECKKTFPKIKDYGMYENYRSLTSIVHAAEAVASAMTTSGGHLRQKPTVMRPGDNPVVFTAAVDEKVLYWGIGTVHLFPVTDRATCCEAVPGTRAAGIHCTCLRLSQVATRLKVTIQCHWMLLVGKGRVCGGCLACLVAPARLCIDGCHHACTSCPR